MVTPLYEIVWTNRSLVQMKKAFEHISKDSVKNANKVVEEIALSVNKAINNPEIYPPDKYKTNNDGTYRAFEKHHYRISYRFENNIIRILRVRHTAMKPQTY